MRALVYSPLGTGRLSSGDKLRTDKLSYKRAYTDTFRNGKARTHLKGHEPRGRVLRRKPPRQISSRIADAVSTRRFPAWPERAGKGEKGC